MTEFQTEISNLFNQGKYSIILQRIEERISSIEDPKERLHLKYLQAEAYYGNREFKVAKKKAELVLSEVTENDNNLVIKGDIENLLGKIYRIYQRYDTALDYYKKAENRFKTRKYPQGLSKVYHNMGNAFMLKGDFKKAKKYHFESLKIAEDLENISAIASSNLNIGSLYYQDGDINEALKHFQNAKNYFERLNDTPSLAAVNLNLAEVYILRNDLNQAETLVQKAIDLYASISNTAGKIVGLKTKARIQKASNQIEDAIETLKTILKEKEGKKSEEILLELGDCYLHNHQLEEGKKIFEMILSLPTKSKVGIAYSLDSLAKVAIDTKDYSEAKSVFKQLVVFLEQMKPYDEASIFATKGNLAYIHLKLGEIDSAFTILKPAKTYYWKIKDFEEFYVICSNFRDGLVEKEQYSLAITVLEDYLIPTVKKTKNQKNLNDALYELAILYCFNGEKQKAITLWLKNKLTPKPALQLPMLNNPTLNPELRDKIVKEQRLFLEYMENQAG